jgi:hypothetical protein
MCVTKWSAITAIGTVLALFVSSAVVSAQVGGGASGVTLTLSPVIGAEAMKVSGTAPPARPLEASVYAAFSRELPTVLLTRRIIPTDPSGHYAATLSHAPAYFRGAVVTVVVRSLPAGSFASAQFLVDAPNVPAPPDELPLDYR